MARANRVTRGGIQTVSFQPRGYYAYCVTNNITGKRYIGITTISVDRRWSVHVSDARCGSKLMLARAIAKYGAECFDVRVIASSWDIDSLRQLERFLIAQEKTLKPDGYNMTAGGDGVFGYRHTDETKEILREKRLSQTIPQEAIDRRSAALRGRPQDLTEEQRLAKAKTMRAVWNREGFREKMSDSLSGRIIGENGRKNMSLAAKKKFLEHPEYRERIRQQKLGSTLSDSAREKLRIAHTGRKFPPEFGAKVSAAKKGKPLHPNTRLAQLLAVTGRKQSQEEKDKRAASLRKTHARRRAMKDTQQCG